MGKFTQHGQPISLTTPLGPDVLLLERLQGSEGLSELFAFQLELLAEAAVDFDKVMGQPATIAIDVPGGSARHINGIVRRIVQGGRVAGPEGKNTFIRYRAELVPNLWLLTRRVQSRIFQHLTVPEILEQILKKEWQLDVHFDLLQKFYPREYCVQYQESDFAFISRLMEDEGIAYYFQHSEKSHQLVLADHAAHYADLPAPQSIRYEEIEGGTRPDDRIITWEKAQELLTCKSTLWDHSFQIPRKHLDATAKLADKVQAGKVSHRLQHQVTVNGIDMLELYEGYGGYGPRHDGISKDGTDQSGNLKRIFEDNIRLAELRMEEEATAALTIQGLSLVRHFAPGFKFSFEHHFDGDGDYLLTRVDHQASLDNAYRTGGTTSFRYENRFSCIPDGVVYRPARHTAKPKVQGTQTATVVGPKGEQIHCDKYGRIKVQFPWDRAGYDGSDQHVLNDSSCWIRVSQPWAGQNWGSITIPRVGQEVVVSFRDGDPDAPLAVGSVYNAEQMPPFKLPDHKTQSGLQTSTQFGQPGNFSGLAFEDLKGSESVQLHGERLLTHSAEDTLNVVAGKQHIHKVGSLHAQLIGGLPGGGSGSGSGRGQGSGRGGGDWTDWSIPTGWAKNLTLTIGEERDAVIGTGVEVVFGTELYTVINPFALLYQLGAPPDNMLASASQASQAGFASSNGYAQAMIGGATDVTYGNRVGIYRGVNWNIEWGSTPEEAATPGVKAAAVFYTLCVAGDMLAQALLHTQTTNPNTGQYTLSNWDRLGNAAIGILPKMAFDILVAVEVMTRCRFMMSDPNAAYAIPIVLRQNLTWKGMAATVLGVVLRDLALGVAEVGAAYFATSSGSGSGSGLLAEPPPIHVQDYSQDYLISAPSIVLSSVGSDTEMPAATIQAVGEDGAAYVGVQFEEAVGLVTVDCGADGTIFLQSGLEKEPNCVTISPEGILISSLELVTILADENTIIVDPEAGITLSAGPSLVEISEEGISLSSGASAIEINAEGITMTGPIITIEGDGEVTVAAPAVMVSE